MGNWAQYNIEGIKQYSKMHQIRSDQSLSRVRLCDPMNRSTPGLPVLVQNSQLYDIDFFIHLTSTN